MHFTSQALNPGSILDFRKLDKNQSPRDWHGRQSRQISEILDFCSSAFGLHFPVGTLQTLPSLFLFLWISLQAVLRISINGRKPMDFSVFAEHLYFVPTAYVEHWGANPLLLHHRGFKAELYWLCPNPRKQKIYTYFEFLEFLELSLFVSKKQLQSNTQGIIQDDTFLYSINIDFKKINLQNSGRKK